MSLKIHIRHLTRVLCLATLFQFGAPASALETVRIDGKSDCGIGCENYGGYDPSGIGGGSSDAPDREGRDATGMGGGATTSQSEKDAAKARCIGSYERDKAALQNEVASRYAACSNLTQNAAGVILQAVGLISANACISAVRNYNDSEAWKIDLARAECLAAAEKK